MCRLKLMSFSPLVNKRKRVTGKGYQAEFFYVKLLFKMTFVDPALLSWWVKNWQNRLHYEKAKISITINVENKSR